MLARELVGELHEDAGLRAALAASPRTTPTRWVFAVDGLIGASPETLVRVDHGTVSARVLAGTASRGADAASDRERAAALAASPKDLAEHALAVAERACSALAPHTARLDASPEPFTLQLPNLWHLATDLKGTLGDGSSSLDLVAGGASDGRRRRHAAPTSRCACSPSSRASTAAATRARWAGSTATATASGRSRCAARRSTPTAPSRAYAGCGIVHDSVPADELAETVMKFRPIVEAFGG